MSYVEMQAKTINIALDTIVIVKSLLKLAKHLLCNIYGRELSTHRKYRTIVRLVKNMGQVLDLRNNNCFERAQNVLENNLG